MASIIGHAKKLKREGQDMSQFKEIQIEPSTGQIREVSPCSGIELTWKDGQIIKFPQVEMLMEFLKKVA
jgi:hypothetical protein